METPGAPAHPDAGRTPLGPVSGRLPCATCGTPVDPLRADRVAFLQERFRYFCTVGCRERYDPAVVKPPPVRQTAAGVQLSVQVVPDEGANLQGRRQSAEALEQVQPSGVDAVLQAADEPDPPGLLAGSDVIEPVNLGSLALSLALTSGTLAAVLALAGPGAVVTFARAILAALGAAALVGRAVSVTRDPVEAHPAFLLAAPTGAAMLALIARLAASPSAGAACTVAGVLVAVVAAGIWLMDRASGPHQASREQLIEALQVSASRVVGDEIVPASSDDLRPGEEIVLEPGDVVPVDTTITAGSAQVEPWLGAPRTEQRGVGDPLVAGARVLDGRLRGVVGWAGLDRAWLRLTVDPRRRADLTAPSASLGRTVLETGAPIAAAIAALSTFATSANWLEVLLAGAAAQACIATAGVAQIGALHISRGVLSALRRGVSFRSAGAFEQAGRVTSAAFCARGTLLLGEPDVASVDVFSGMKGEKITAERVLALVAGAESGATDPVAAALQRAARDRGLRPDGVRSPTRLAGMGVTAVASSGQELVVGSRALMLRQRVAVGIAEAKLNELEVMGRSVMLVALGGHLVGVLGMQDGLRPGARAAVQHLLDAGIEPVLLSGDTRETCEAIGRTLDIEHVRPEVLPSDRGDEVRSIAESGATVAVLGRSPQDDLALAAASVSVALGSAGSTAAEWNVELASDDVRDAAFSLRLAAHSRREARLGLALAVGPGAAAALVMAVGLLPVAAAPVFALLGTLLSLGRLHLSDAE